jgi:uncharacterized protein (DUF849 family)
MSGRPPDAFPFPAFPLTPYPPVVVNVALTGMVAGSARVPHLPVTAEEIADDAEACFRAGATVAHIHARDGHERPEWRREAYAELIPEIRRRCPGIVVCATTSGRECPDVERRADVLMLDGDARPDMASLTPIETVEELARRMAGRGIRPELEIFDLGMAHLAQRLLDRGLLEPPLTANLLLGFPNGAPADARSLVALVGALPRATNWAAAGMGAFQRPANALAIAMGGNVRTGLEDNPHLDHDTGVPARNVELVERAALLADAAGRRTAGADETRALLGIAPAGVPAAG